jgi:hypothetical protein
MSSKDAHFIHKVRQSMIANGVFEKASSLSLDGPIRAQSPSL